MKRSALKKLNSYSPDSSTTTKLVKIGEASELIGVSIDTLRRWEKKGWLKAVKTPGGTRLYDKEQLAKLNPNLKRGPKPSLVSPILSTQTEAPVSTSYTPSFSPITPDTQIHLNSDQPILKISNSIKPHQIESDIEKTFSRTDSSNSKNFFSGLIISPSAISILKKNIQLCIVIFLLAVPVLLLSNYITGNQKVSSFINPRLSSNFAAQAKDLTLKLANIFSPSISHTLFGTYPTGSPPGIFAKRNNKNLDQLASGRVSGDLKGSNFSRTTGSVLADSTPSGSFLQINLDTQINGSLSVNTASISGKLSSSTINTGFGDNEVYPMDQPLLTSSSPTFAGLKLSSLTLSAASNQLTLGNTIISTQTGGSGAFTVSIPALSANANFLLDNATQTLTNKSISGSSNTITNIPNSALTNPSITISAGSGLSGGGSVSLGGSITLSAIASTSAVNSITGTTNQITASSSTGDITLSLPQDIATTSTPAFSGVKLNGATSGTTTLNASAVTTSYTLTLPSDDGTSGYVLQTDGSGNTSWVANGGCSNCLFTDPSATQTITPTSSTAIGLSVAQAAGGSVDIFNITNNTGATKYFKVDSSGNIDIGQTLNLGTGNVSFYTGSGTPSNGTGSNGDYYFRSDGTGGSTSVYYKVSGAWVSAGGGTLQSSYDAGNTITTSTGRDIAFTLASGLVTSTSFSITNAGTATGLVLNDTNGGTNTSLDIQSSGSSTFTVTENGVVNISSLTASSAVYTDGSKNLTTTAPTSGTIGYWSRTGTTLSPATAGDNITTSGNISTSGTGALTVAGATSLNGTIGLGDATGDTITFNGQVGSSIVPNTNDTYDLGSGTNRWQSLYLATNSGSNAIEVNDGFSNGGQLATGASSFVLRALSGNNLNLNTGSDDGSTGVVLKNLSSNNLWEVNSQGKVTQTVRTTGTAYDYVLENGWLNGTLLNADYGSAVSQTSGSSITGLNLDFSTNLTVANTAGTNQTGIALTLKDGGASTTATGISIGGTVDTAISIGATVGTADISLSNGETISNTTNNQINLGLGSSGTLLLTSSTAATITNSAGPLNINAQATALNLQADGSIDVNIAGGSSATGCTITNSSGALACTGAVTGSNISGTNTGDQNLFSLIAVPTQTSISANSTTTTLNINAGSGVTLATDNTTKTLTISATGTGGDITAVGDVLTGAAFTSGGSGNSLYFNNNSNIGQLTATTLTGTRTWTLPDATGTICVSGSTCASSGTVGYWSRAGTTLSTATANDNLTIDGVTTANGTLAANGQFNIGDGGDAGAINATTLDIDATGALQINSSGGAIGIGNDAVAQAINIGTGAAARTITLGNGTGATALNFTSGTGAQTFTSSVVSGTTTSSAFAFNASSLTTGTALYVTSSATSGKTVDINATQTSGTIFNLAYGSSKTLSGNLTGLYVDLNSGNVDATNQNLTGVNFKIPTVTDTHTTGTKTLTGMLVNFGSGAGINQNGAGGTLEYVAGDFYMPALTQTAGTLNAYGTRVTTPATITTGGTAYGNYISATGVGAGNLNGLGISSITGGSGTEYALNIGSGWDAVLRVGSTTVINGSGITQVAGGGTGAASFTSNGILYGNGSSTLGVTAAGTTGQVLIGNTGSAPSWGSISGSTCTDCVVTDPSADQTIAPTGQSTTGLAIRQTSTASPTDDIFQITDSSGSTKYFYVDKDGNVSTAGTSAQTLTLTPLTNTTALTLVGTNVTSQPLQYINSKNSSATTGIINMAYGAAQALSGSVIGFRQDLSTNVTATNQSVTGYQITLPGATNTSGTQAYAGISISGGSINENGGTATTFTGADITIPALTQTSGTLTAYGVNITTPSSITTGGTASGFNVNAAGVGAGTLNGINVGSITGGAGTENGIQIGSGWDNNILLNDTTSRVALANGGTLTILDTLGNSLCTITDSGSVGDLSCTGTISGSGAVGYWTRTGSTLSTSNASDNVTVDGTTTANGTFAANGQFNVGDGGDAGTINATTLDIDATGALQINSSGGAIGIGNDAVAQAINIGTGAAARTITTGNATGATALAFNSGTGSQTFTSQVVSGTTTTSAFVFSSPALTTGTGSYFTSSSITQGKLLQVSTGAANTLTTGTLADIRTTSTALTGATGTGSLMNLDWTPGSATTATGDLFALNIGANGSTTGNLFNILDSSASIFSVSEVAMTTSLPANFTSPGDVSIAYDLNFTNPVASYIKSYSALTIQPGDSFGSSNLTLSPYNEGSVYVPSNVATAYGLDVDANLLSTGRAVDVSSSSTAGGASGSSYLLYLDRSGANTNTAHTAYGLYSSVTNTNGTSGTNTAAYLTASGANTANYALYVAAGNVNIQGLAVSSAVYTDGSKNLTTTAPSSGTIGYWSRTGTTLSPATSGDAITTSGNISTSSTGTITSAGTLTASSGFTMTTGALSLTSTSGAISSTGLTGLTQTLSSGTAAITAPTLNLNTSSTGATAIGNSTGTFALTSSGGLNVTTGGALTGVASIDTISTSATALTFAGAGTISSTTSSALTLDTGTTGTLNLGTGNNAKTINLGTGTAGNTINIGTDNTTLDAISIGSALDTLAVSSTGFTLSTGGNGDFAGTLIAGTANAFQVSTSGFVGIGASAPTTTALKILANTTGVSQINLTASSAVNVSSPNNGDLWYNGTNLYFYNGSTNKDLLAAAAGSSPFTSSAGVITQTTSTDKTNLVVGETGDYGLLVSTSVAPTVDLAQITNGNATITDGVDGLAVNFTTGDGSNPTNSGINVNLTSGGTSSGDVLNGINLALTGTSGTEKGINFADNNFDLDINAVTDLNLGIGGTSALKIASTGITSIGNVAHSIVDSAGALVIDSNSTSALNIGTGNNAKTITIGNATGATALAFNSGTGPQTFTSQVVTGTTTTSAFVMDATAINSGTGFYLTSDSITTGKLAQISTDANNTLTTGTLLDLRTTATSLTGTAGVGSLMNLDWSPGSVTTATGDLFSLNIGTNGTTTGNLFNILDTNASIFSISETAMTTSLPSNFTAAGDVAIAYDINFTNPTASYIKSSAPLAIVAGETFNSSNLTLGTYNQGTVVFSTNNTTSTAVDLTNTTLTTGTLLNIAASSTSQTSDTLLNIAQTGGTTGITGTVAAFSTSATTNSAARVLTLTAAGMTTGTVQTIAANALTTGGGLSITSSSAAVTTATLLNVAQSGVSANQSGATAALSTTATTTSTARLLTLTANAMTTGTVQTISANALTTGTALAISSSAAGGLTSGNLLTLAKTGGTTAAFTGDIANMNYTSTYTTTGLTHSGNVLDLGRAITIASAITNTVSGALFTISDAQVANNASATVTYTGDTASITRNCTRTSGACTNSGNLMTLTSSDASHTGNSLSIADSATHASGGNSLLVTANSVQSGNIMSISGTALTSGAGLSMTGSSVGSTSSLLRLTGTVGQTGTSTGGMISSIATLNAAATQAVNTYISSTLSTATTSYGIYQTLSDTGANANSAIGINSIVAGSNNAAKTLYAMQGQVTSSSTTADTSYSLFASSSITGAISSGTRNVTGVRANMSVTAPNTGGTTNIFGIDADPSHVASANSTGSTVNIYGGRFSTTGTLNTGGTINQYGVYVGNGSTGASGTSSKYGVYIEAMTGATNNAMLYFGGAPATANNAGLCWDGAGDSAVYDCNGAPTDLAENYGTSDSSIGAGDVVIMTGQAQQVLDPREGKITTKAFITKSTGAYNSQILGIVSTNPNQVYGEDGLFSASENPRPVSLSGRVPVKVSTENGQIKAGDYLTSSSIPGVAMKATQPGITLGRALNDYNGSAVGKVIVYVHTGFADPSEALANLLIGNNGQLLGTDLNMQKITVATTGTFGGLVSASNFALDAGLLNRSGALASVPVSGSNKVTIADAVNSLNTSVNQNAQVLGEVKSNVASQSAHLAEVEQLSNQAIEQSRSLDNKVASTSANLSSLSSRIDDLLASISGSTPEASNSSNPSDSLTPPSALIATDSATFKDVSVTESLSTLKLDALDATISGTFKSLGETFLGQTTIAGDLSVDGTLSFTNGNSINAFPTLFFQNNPLAQAVDFFNGKITLDKNGVLATDALALGDQSLGEATITAGQTEVTIPSGIVTPTSRIFLTPQTSLTGNLYVGQKVEGSGFKVKLSEPNLTPVKFNWMIVQTKAAVN